MFLGLYSYNKYVENRTAHKCSCSYPDVHTFEVLHRFIFTTSINKRDKSFTILTIFHMIVSEVVTGRGYAFVVSLFGSPLTKTREKSRKDTRFKVLSACIILIRLSMEF